MSLRSRIERAVRELLALAVLATLVLATGWAAYWGFRRSGPYALSTGLVVGLFVVGFEPVRSTLDSACQRVSDAVPRVVGWLCCIGASSALGLVDRATMARWAPVIAGVFGGLLVVWCWSIATSLPRLRDAIAGETGKA
ncbi:hypothetical protein SAMN05216559_3996 [Halomicrobium zhouii]|uniref:Uncharacterized protein n=1 Tax=Halomicrobium zhouii TaxID=767519 RepID=A0A1I6M8H6_9EURY|nr:hypothetical protein [Halomicrobium zhouii]SFS12024.1 hypothetical protein SAMN05216559_3996 [Halomicrobium zhouii]